MTELELEVTNSAVELEIDDSVEVVNYANLVNKPKINSVELVGNKTSSDLGLVDEDDLDNYYTKNETDDLLEDKANADDVYTKTESDNKYVAQVSGKGLSTNDYTNADKSKVDNIPSTIITKISAGEGIVTSTSSGEALISLSSESQASLELADSSLQPNDNISELTNDSGYITNSYHDNTKQDTISDLSTIRSGASLGATALQSVPNTYRTSADQDVIDNTKENTSNKVTSISSSSTDTQYPSAKLVYDELGNKADKKTIKTTMDSVANVETEYFLGEQSSVSFTLPSATAGQSIVVVFYSGATATTLSVSGTYLGTLPTPTTNSRYELNFLYDGSYWVLLSNSMVVE